MCQAVPPSRRGWVLESQRTEGEFFKHLFWNKIFQSSCQCASTDSLFFFFSFQYFFQLVKLNQGEDFNEVLTWL